MAVPGFLGYGVLHYGLGFGDHMLDRAAIAEVGGIDHAATTLCLAWRSTVGG